MKLFLLSLTLRKQSSQRPEFRRVGDAIAEFKKKDPTVLATEFDIQLEKVKKGFYGWIGKSVANMLTVHQYHL